MTGWGSSNSGDRLFEIGDAEAANVHCRQKHYTCAVDDKRSNVISV